MNFHIIEAETSNKLQELWRFVQNCLYRRSIDLRDEGVFVVSDLRSACAAQDYRDDIEAARTVLYIIAREEISGGSFQSVFFGRCDGILDIGEFFVGLGSDLNKDDTAVGIDHDQVKFAGFTAKISSECFEPFAFEELLALLFSPSAEQFPIR